MTDIRLSDVQYAFVQDDRPFTVFYGGIGSGKTTAAGYKALLRHILPSPTTGMVIGPTYGILRDSTWRTIEDIWSPYIINHNKNEHSVTFENGSTVLLRSGHAPNKLRGPNLHWVWIDEASLCAKDVWDIALGRIRAGGKLGNIFLTFTTAGKSHWTYKVFVLGSQSDPENFKLYTTTTASSPFLDTKFSKILENQYTDAFAKQELEGEFIEYKDGLVDPSRFTSITKSLIPTNMRLVRYWDLAVSTRTAAAYTATALAGYDAKTHTYYILDLHRVKDRWSIVREYIYETVIRERGTIQGLEGALQGTSLYDELISDPKLLRTTFKLINVEKDKVSRALPWFSRASAGTIVFADVPGLHDLKAEAEMFPHGKTDDLIDAVSGAYAMIAESSSTLLAAVPSSQPVRYGLNNPHLHRPDIYTPRGLRLDVPISDGTPKPFTSLPKPLGL